MNPRTSFINFTVTALAVGIYTPSCLAQVGVDETAWTKLIDDALRYETLGEKSKAEAYYEQAVVEAKRIDPNGPHVIRALLESGVLQEKMGNLTAAEKFLNEAQKAAKAMLGREGQIWQSSCLWALADLYGAQGRSDDRMKALADQAKIDEATPKDTTDFSSGFSRLQYDIRKQWHPPANKISRLVTVYWQMEKDGHIELLRTHQSSGDATTDEAAVAAVRSLSDTRSLPPSTLGPVWMSMDFAYNLVNKDGTVVPPAYAKQSDSVETSLKALQDAEAASGHDSPNLIALLLSHALTLDNAGKFSEAEQACERALKIYKNNNGTDNGLLCNIYGLLAKIKNDNRDVDKAEKSYKAALKATEDRSDEGAANARAEIVNEYSSMLFKLGRHAEAKELRLEEKQPTHL